MTDSAGRGPRLQVNDPNMMRALAHRARLKIAGLLMNGVEATATECAEYCGLSPSATSYHLRALARFGIIEEAESRGDARERVWRSKYGGMTFETIGNDEDFGGADLALAGAVISHQEQATREFLKRTDELPKEWEEGAGLVHARLRMTAADGKELLRKLDALLEPYRRRNDTSAPMDAVRTFVMFRLFPELTPRGPVAADPPAIPDEPTPPGAVPAAS
jgi:DNA-binding transcriptional ArsR family regulator